MIKLLLGDCIEVMKRLPAGCVDLVLCDLPYGVTQNKWDSVIPFQDLWEQYLRVSREDANFVFTATQPFTSALVMSNPTMFKYDWVWRKPKGTGHLNAKKQPMRDKEDILVFSRGKAVYNPQMTSGDPYKARGGKRNDDTYGSYTSVREDNVGMRYPKQIQEFPIVERDKLHPSQKPVELMEYMIKTYSNSKSLVLDNCMGSGSTGIACLRTDRHFIGIEKNEDYFNAAFNRVSVEQANLHKTV